MTTNVEKVATDSTQIATHTQFVEATSIGRDGSSKCQTGREGNLIKNV